MINRMQSVLKIRHLHSDGLLCFAVRNHPRQFSNESAGNQTTTAGPIALSYLINECGIRPEKAASAVKYAQFKTPEKANSVLQFFRTLGFSTADISKIIGRRPRLLLSDPDKQFAPRISFLESQGFSPSDIAQVLLRGPEIFYSSVAKQLLPNFEFIKSVVLSSEKAVQAIRRSPLLLTCKLETYLIPSIETLKENGISDSNIVRLLVSSPLLTMLTPQAKLSEAVERVKEMGIDPKSTTFAVAMETIKATKVTWDGKVDAYKKWGWTDEVIRKAFTKSPWCMAVSVKKIGMNMDYYVNEMGFDALDIADRPLLLAFSLKKRIVPRDRVLRGLLSKGLIDSRSLFQALTVTDEMFEKKYLVPYKEEASELLELFRENIRA